MPEPLQVRGAIPHIGLAERLLIARRYAGLDQRELSALIGVSPRSIYAAESGRSRPRRPVLVSWSLATGVSLEWIIEGDLIPDASGQAGSGVILPRSRPVTSHGSALALGGMARRPAIRRPPGRPGAGLRPGLRRAAGPVNNYRGLCRHLPAGGRGRGRRPARPGRQAPCCEG